ncbi:MAG: DUF3306 domain-containing protein [Motiliproteus sp.]
MSESRSAINDAADDAEDGFLSRWSRLKSQPELNSEPDTDLETGVRADLGLEETHNLEQTSSHPTASDAGLQAFDLAAEQPVAEPEPLTDADMPDIETLDEQSDFSGFFSEKVSEQLRSKALKKLFHLPEFNIRDGLNEYDEDYSKFIPLGDTVTYQMKQFIERQKQQFKDALEDDDSGSPDTAATIGSGEEKTGVDEGDPSAQACTATPSSPASADPDLNTDSDQSSDQSSDKRSDKCSKSLDQLHESGDPDEDDLSACE